MRIWKGTLLILLVLLMLTACGAEHSTSSEPDSTQNASESATQYSNLEDDASDDAPLEWPVELMGDILPVPSGVITSIDRGDTFFGSDAPAYITIVSFKAMSREDCGMYVNKLIKLGFTDDVTEQEVLLRSLKIKRALSELQIS